MRRSFPIAARVMVAWLVCSGTDARPPQRASPDVINAVDFGARCDGSFDDTKAFQAAVNAAHARDGGVVVAPAGTCILTNVRIYAHVKVQGAGRDVTTFVAKSAMTVADRVVDEGDLIASSRRVVYEGGIMFWNHYSPAPGGEVSDVELSDFTIDGNWSAQTRAGVQNYWGIYLNRVARAHIANVRVRNCLNHGITLKNSVAGVIENVLLERNGRNLEPSFGGSAGGDGICLLAGSHDNEVRDSIAIENASIGFEDEGRFGPYVPVNRNSRNRWRNLRSEGNRDHGLLLLFTDDAIVENLTTEGGARGSGSAAINVVGTRRTTIRGARLLRSGGDGLAIQPECYNERRGGPCQNDGNRNGVNVDLAVTELEVLGAARLPIRIEDAQGGRIEVKVHGKRGATAAQVMLPSSGSASRVDLALEMETSDR